jgi:RNA polymerase sigma-70 factor (ECF subfamily)
MIEKESHEECLVAAAKAGDRDACGELFELHVDRVFRTTRRITKNLEDAEDAAQESFVSAFVHLQSFGGRSRFSTWLTRIAINTALMRLRMKRGVPGMARLCLADADVPLSCEPQDASPNPEERYAEHERTGILRQAVRKLRPTLRETVEVYLRRQGSLQETAETLRISQSAAKTRLFHARAALYRTIYASIQARRNPAGRW